MEAEGDSEIDAPRLALTSKAEPNGFYPGFQVSTLTRLRLETRLSLNQFDFQIEPC